MLKFPQLLFLLLLAALVRMSACASEPGHAFPTGSAQLALVTTGAPQKVFTVPDGATGNSGFLHFVAVPEPGVFVALISGATILIARRRR